MIYMLDAYCCAGGAARGYKRAAEALGVELNIIGLDKDPQPRYPYTFVQGDCLELLANPFFMANFHCAHASPPCQHDSVASKSHNGRAAEHPDLIGPTQELLDAWGGPFIIENVKGAREKLRDPMMLCGTMFDGLRVKRHRYFEANFELTVPPKCRGKHPLHYTRDKRKPHYGQLDEMTAFVSVNGGGNCSIRAASDAMGIDWMTKEELNEAIPPAYTELLGTQMFEHVLAERIAA